MTTLILKITYKPMIPRKSRTLSGGLLRFFLTGWFLAMASAPGHAGTPDENLRRALEFFSSSRTNLLPRTEQTPETAIPEGEPSTKSANLRGDCAECHRQLQPHLVYQWEGSRHAQVNVGCDKCHGRNHSQIFRENGKVSARVCSDCHPRQGREFAPSRHAAAEVTLVNSSLFKATSEASREACFGCHRIGAAYLDGSRGSCNFCHPGHTFSAADAREPEACTGCHTGEDYPQDLAYWTSKHGALYSRTRHPKIAPTCVTCHQPEGIHGDDFGIALGGGGTGGILSGQSAPVPMREISAQEFSEKRAAMISVCANCHSSRFAEDSLRRADQIKAEGNAFLTQAAKIIQALHSEGRIGGGADVELHLGGEQLPVEPTLPGSELLNRFYEMWRFHYAWTWKGAYHTSYSVSNLRSRPGLASDLNAIRAAAARLQKGESPCLTSDGP